MRPACRTRRLVAAQRRSPHRACFGQLVLPYTGSGEPSLILCYREAGKPGTNVVVYRQLVAYIV